VASLMAPRVAGVGDNFACPENRMAVFRFRSFRLPTHGKTLIDEIGYLDKADTNHSQDETNSITWSSMQLIAARLRRPPQKVPNRRLHWGPWGPAWEQRAIIMELFCCSAVVSTRPCDLPEIAQVSSNERCVDRNAAGNVALPY